MKEKRSQERPACSIKSEPFPTEVTCPECGVGVEIWSDENETSCALCGYSVYRHERYVN
ncbi:MAG: hypothetical protein JSV21_06065 [Nitrospirota bacterium]|nr:MAG: hypothetical protein JSV21_06065 [Nitrospirota bacterium]